MSLYNMLMGHNPLAGDWLGFLEIHPNDFGRFRDAWLEEKSGEIRIVVLTRCGGGNREEYMYVFEDMREHPQYIESYDDEYDPTYALFVFQVPEKYKSWIDDLLEQVPADKRDVVVDNRSLQERFERATKQMTSAMGDEKKKEAKPPTTTITSDIIGGSESISIKGASSRNPEFHTMTVGAVSIRFPQGVR
jgi:hypothetical protein